MSRFSGLSPTGRRPIQVDGPDHRAMLPLAAKSELTKPSHKHARRSLQEVIRPTFIHGRLNSFRGNAQSAPAHWKVFSFLGPR